MQPDANQGCLNPSAQILGYHMWCREEFLQYVSACFLLLQKHSGLITENRDI